MQKTARTRSADLIHVKIEGIGIGNVDVFGVLSPDLKDRVHLRVYLHRTPCVGCYLIDDQIHIQKISYHVPAGASRSCAHNFNVLPYVIANKP